MNCSLYETEEYTLELNDSENIVSKLHIVKYNGSKYAFLQAIQKRDPSEFSVEIYYALQNYIKNKEVYLDLSDIYGVNNNSWLVKWTFITGDNDELLDEEFYRLADIEETQKDEYIILKNYIVSKQNIYS